jgi:hypothetical protein
MNSERKLNLGLRFFLPAKNRPSRKSSQTAIRKHVTKRSAIALRHIKMVGELSLTAAFFIPDYPFFVVYFPPQRKRIIYGINQFTGRESRLRRTAPI